MIALIYLNQPIDIYEVDIIIKQKEK